MKLDEKDFFREATLRICSSLDIEKALWQCLLYIRKHIPANQMSLHLYDHSIGIVETVAYATYERGAVLSFKTTVPPKIREALEQRGLKRIRVFDRMGEYEGTREIARKLNSMDSSCAIMDLGLEGKFLGVLTVADDGKEKFNQEHIRLLSLLNEPVAVAFTNSMRYRELSKLKDMLADESRYFQGELRRLAGEKIIGADSGLRGVMQMVRQVAPLNSPILLMGETGVGKEIIAGAIHSASTCCDGPLIKVNCGAIPDSLMDSELFGHEKGAFTGALYLKRGRFERAHGGTLFLDEIGELSPDAQVRLLRVLQEKEIERVGGTEIVKLDIRLIAATHQDLKTMLAEGRFREDLYYRLKVFPIVIPPLRDRIADIPALIEHFIRKKSYEMKLSNVPTLASGAIDRLMSYPWPGNVRELENAMERALILSSGHPLSFDNIETSQRKEMPNRTDLFEEEIFTLDTVVAKHIHKALKLTKGKVHGKGGAAEVLDIDPSTLRHRMRKLGIPFGRNAKKRQNR